MGNLVQIILLLLILATPGKSYAEGKVSLSPSEGHSPLFQTIADDSLVIHYGFQTEKVSFDLVAQNDLEKSKLYYLIFLWSHLDEVEVCLKNGKCSKAGYAHSVSSWPIPQIFPVFPIEISPNQSEILKIKIHSKNFIESEIQLLSAEQLFRLISWQTGLVFSFLIMIFSFLVRLIYLTIAHPIRWMIFNLGFHFCITLVFVFGSGIANCYLFPNQAIPLSQFKKIIIGVLIFMGSGWLSNYLGTKSYFPKAHKLYQLTYAISLILIFASFTNLPRLYISICFTGIYLGITILSLILAIKKLQDQLKPTPWLILSLLCLLFFEILNILSYETFDSHDSKIYLLFLAIFLPANAFFVSKTINDRLTELDVELTLSKKEINQFKQDLNLSLNTPELSDKKSYLKGVDTEKIVEKLKNLMTNEKIFLEEELRLVDLSALLGLSLHQTSEILNQILKISFPDLLKQYRIEEAKRMLIDEKDKSILEIALDCGFQSKSVFNDSFKKNLAMTPIEYRRKMNTV